MEELERLFSDWLATEAEVARDTDMVPPLWVLQGNAKEYLMDRGVSEVDAEAFLRRKDWQKVYGDFLAYLEWLYRSEYE